MQDKDSSVTSYADKVKVNVITCRGAWLDKRLTILHLDTHSPNNMLILSQIPCKRAYIILEHANKCSKHPVIYTKIHKT